ncbi:hypothetical protein GCM10023100_42550 [Actinocorallia cavernae]|uniref:Histidine kinase/HSP90-like ATPase domain-containing protein n=3 Tax=Actinomycetota TaxID=201174 RepID=A0ABP8SSW5_9ACTN
MSATPRVCARVTLSPQEIDRWPDTPVARALATLWPRSRTATFSLPAMDRAVPICRSLTRSWLAQQRFKDEDICDTVLLISTELATNAIVHTGSAVITMSLRRNKDHLRIQVRDQGTQSAGKHWHNTSGFGRGLEIIASYAGVLGTRRGADGTRTMWATVNLA